MYVKVIIDLPVRQIDKPYDYIVPEIYKNKIKTGMRVVVNFHNQQRMAYVIDKTNKSEHATKEVSYLLDNKPILTKRQLDLIKYIKETSFSSYEEAFRAVVPVNLTVKYEKRFKILDKKLLTNNLKDKIKENYLFLDDLNENEQKEIN